LVLDDIVTRTVPDEGTGPMPLSILTDDALDISQRKKVEPLPPDITGGLAVK
jgi:hypothetical protein